MYLDREISIEDINYANSMYKLVKFILQKRKTQK